MGRLRSFSHNGRGSFGLNQLNRVINRYVCCRASVSCECNNERTAAVAFLFLSYLITGIAARGCHHHWVNQLQLQLQAPSSHTSHTSSAFIPSHSHPNMKSSLLLPLCTAALVAAVYPPQVILGDSQAPIAEADKYLIELAPGETQWVTEDDKWALRRVRAWLFRDSSAAGQDR